jgi:hypothetical protein
MYSLVAEKGTLACDVGEYQTAAVIPVVSCRR